MILHVELRISAGLKDLNPLPCSSVLKDTEKVQI